MGLDGEKGRGLRNGSGPKGGLTNGSGPRGGGGGLAGHIPTLITYGSTPPPRGTCSHTHASYNISCSTTYGRTSMKMPNMYI